MMEMKIIKIGILLSIIAISLQLTEINIRKIQTEDQKFQKYYFISLINKFKDFNSFIEKLKQNKPKFLSKHYQSLKKYYLQSQGMKRRGLKLSTNQTLHEIDITNFYEEMFYGEVKLGTPPQSVQVVYDTGSSDLWVPASNCVGCNTEYSYNPNASSTASQQSGSYSISYIDGINAQGFNINDTISVGGLEATNFQFEIINQANDFNISRYPFDGVFGIAYSSASNAYPQNLNIFQVLKNNNQIKNAVFAFFITPNPSEAGSKLTIGGYNENYFTGEIHYNKVFADTGFFTINYEGFEVNNQTVQDSSTIVDSGTALIHSSYSVVQALIGIVGQINSDCSGLDKLPIINVMINQIPYPFKPEQYVLNSHFNQQCVFGISDNFGGESILGDGFLKVYYTIFDLDLNRIGFAKSISYN